MERRHWETTVARSRLGDHDWEITVGIHAQTIGDDVVTNGENGGFPLVNWQEFPFKKIGTSLAALCGADNICGLRTSVRRVKDKLMCVSAA